MEKLKEKDDGGEPMSKEKARVRKAVQTERGDWISSGIDSLKLYKHGQKLQNMAAQSTADMCSKGGLPGFRATDTADGGEK